MHAAVLRYRVMAYITGVVLIVLCFVGIPLQIAGHPAVANIVGVVPALLHIPSPAAPPLRARGRRLRAGPPVRVRRAATPRVLPFVVERWLPRRYINPAIAAAAPSTQ